MLNLLYLQDGDHIKALDCLRTVTFLCTDVFREQDCFVSDIANYTANSIAEYEEILDEQNILLLLLKHFDHFQLHNEGDDMQEHDADAEKVNDFKNDGYLYGRNENKAYLKWVPTLPAELKHCQLMNIPEYRLLQNPIMKAMNKIRISNVLNSFPKDPHRASSKFNDQEETTARSMSSASKLFDIKSGYKKIGPSEESALEGLGSFASTKFMESKKSLHSATARKQSSDPAITNATPTKLVSEKPKKKKKINFNYEYQPSVLTTTTCRIR